MTPKTEAALAAAHQMADLIQCRVDDTRAESGRMTMVVFDRSRMEALEKALIAFRAATQT